MRLKESAIKAIKNNAEVYFGSDVSIWLFGSRADSSKKVVILICMLKQQKLILMKL